MAYDNKGFEVMNKSAKADYTDKQFYAVKLAGSGEFELAGAGDPILGILQDKPDIGRVAPVRTERISKAVCGGAFTEGDKLQVDANGKLVVGTGTPAEHLVALALEDSGADGEIHAVLLKDLGTQ